MATERIPLTDKQTAVYDFSVRYFRENDQLPSSREMMSNFGWFSQNTAIQYYRSLAKKNWIERNACNKYRFIRPIIDNS